LKLHAYTISNGVSLSQSSIDELKARHIAITISLDGIGTFHDSQRPFISGRGSFTYEEVRQLGRQVHCSMARAIQPFQTINDGDVLYAVTTNEVDDSHVSGAMLGILASKLA